MQKALLGAAIALILVLVTALVGPLFVDWGRYRKTFETEISRLTRLDVGIGGPIDLRLLPTPTLRLRQIALGRPGSPVGIRAEALQIELALGALMRGHFLASDVAVQAPEISLKFGGSERLEWAPRLFAFDPDVLSIAHLTVERGRVSLADGSGRSLLLDRLGFNGELRSLLGPATGEGTVAIAGESYLFRIAADRAAAGEAVKLRLLVDTLDHVRIGDVDSSIWIERGMPHFAGTLQWSQAAGRSAQGFNEQWRASAKMHGNWTAVALEGISLQYGSEDRAVQFRGHANLTFHARPELDVTLAATQIDLGRALALSPAARRRPLTAMRILVDNFGAAKLPPIQANFVISAETMTVADAPLQQVSASLRGVGDAWDLESLEMRAPGGTQVGLRGHLDRTARGATFVGHGRIDTRDSRALVSWLTAGGDREAFAGPFRAEGDMRLSGESVGLDHFKAEFDRDTLEGNFAYFAQAADRPARISATLSASNIDLDRAYALTQRISGDTALAWPREGSLSLNAERAAIAGIEAKGTEMRLQFDERALTVERLAIDDFAGARIAADGSFDIRTLAPRDTIRLDLDMRAPDGVAMLVEKFNAPAAAALRRAPSRLFPAKLQGSLVNDAQAAREAGMPAGAGFKIDGNAGAFTFGLHGVAESAGDGSLSTTFRQFGSAKVVVAGRVAARDGRTLVEAAGLDRLVSVDDRAGSLDFKASGRLDDAMAATAQIAAGGLGVSLDGTLQAVQGRAATANLMLSVAQANVRFRQAEILPTMLTARLSYADGAIMLDQINGTVAGSDIAGRLAIGLSPTGNLDGDIKLGTVDIPAVITAAIGTSSKPAADGSAWPTTPFTGGILGQYGGRIAITSARAMLAPKLAAENLHGTLNFGLSDIALDDFEADIAGGHVSGRLAFERNGDELSAMCRIMLTNADLTALLPGDPPPMSGRLKFDAEIEGSGRSAVALVRSLQGKGTFNIDGGRLARLDPAAFDAVIHSVDQGLPIQQTRIREHAEAALSRDALSFQGDGSVAVTAGRASLAETTLRAEGADVTISAQYDLVARMLDATLTLIGPTGTGDAETGRPQIAIILRGPIDSPQRTLDVAGLSDWLSKRAMARNARHLAAIPAPLDAPAIVLPRPLAAAAQPSPPPGEAKTEASAVPPNLARSEPAAGTAAAANQETTASLPSAAKPTADTLAPAKPEPSIGPPGAARDTSPIGTPGQANLAPARSPADPVIAELDRAIAANPSDGAALAKRGQMFAVNGNYGFAIRDFDEVIRLRPRDAEALNNRCWARAIVGDLESALRDCNAALQLRPRYADAFDSRGMINLKSGQLNKAIADYDAALRINPKLASSLYGRGIAKIRSDNPTDGNLDIVEAKSIRVNIAEEFAGYGIR